MSAIDAADGSSTARECHGWVPLSFWKFVQRMSLFVARSVSSLRRNHKSEVGGEADMPKAISTDAFDL